MEQEQRAEGRVEHAIKFFVHVHESENEPDMVGMSLQCEAIDFSAHGLQFSTNSQLTPKTSLNITIGIGEPFAMYLLRGEVRWVRKEGDAYHMGVLLLPEKSTDLDRWLENFHNQFQVRD